MFCGVRRPGNRMSGEHFWSDWMGPLLPQRSHRLEELINYTRPPGRTVQGRTERTLPGAPHSKKIEVVCKKCNSEWMSVLEGRVRPFLSPMIKGQFVALDEVARGMVARWIVLKTLVMEQEKPIGTKALPLHTDAEYQDFMNSWHVPDGFKIWIGHSDTQGDWGNSFSRYTGGIGIFRGDIPPTDFVPPAKPPNIQTITWGIGHLRVFVASTTDPDVRDGIGWNLGHFLPLWPIAEGDIVWPPSLRVLDQDMIELKELLLRYTEAGPHKLS
jgi:hypothetical protein